MLEKFTKKSLKQTGSKSSAQNSPAKADELPKIYAGETDKLEQPKNHYGLVVLSCLLATILSLTAVFIYEGFFKKTAADDKNGQKIIIDKQENITVTAEERINDLGETASQAVVNFYKKPTDAGGYFYEESEAFGSGVILTSDGWLITTKGLLEKIGGEKYIVLTANLSAHEPKSVLQDPGSDLVFIKIEAKDLPVAKLGETNKLSSGQEVFGFIASCPKSKLASLHIAKIGTGASETIVESTEELSTAVFCREGYDASLFGAPVINLAGETVALVHNQSEAVPIDYAKPILENILKKNEIERAYLGVGYISLSAHPKINLKTGELLGRGALLSGYKNKTAVAKGSPAEKAGFKSGDIILAVEDESVGLKTLGEIIQTYKPGQKIKITAIRDEKERVLEAILGKQ